MDLSVAIMERRVVTFTYDGLPRIVRPAALGEHVRTGNPSLRGYQDGGESKTKIPEWRLFTVAKIADLTVTPEVFHENPPGYQHDDSDLHVQVELN